MVKIDPDDILTSGVYIYIQFALAAATLLVSIVTAFLFVMKTERKRTYFYYAMSFIVAGSIITSILYFGQNICDTDVLKVDYCPPWMINEVRFVLWETCYVMLLSLIVASTFKYTVIKTLNRWNIDFQPLIILGGLFFFLAASSLNILAFTPERTLLKVKVISAIVLGFLTYALFFDVAFLIFLLKKLRDTRKICVTIPKNVNQAYTSTRNAILFFLFVIPVVIILFFLNALLNPTESATYDNIFNLTKNLIHFFIIVYFSLDVQAMILIKRLAEVEDCSSSFFGLDSTLVASQNSKSSKEIK